MDNSGLERGVGDNDIRHVSPNPTTDSDRSYLLQVKQEQDARDAATPIPFIDRRRKPMERRDWGVIIFRWITSIAGLFLILIVTHAYVRYFFPPPLPYVYHYLPLGKPATICPGDNLVYASVIDITQAPVVINLYRSIYSDDIDQTVIFGENPVVAIHDHPHTITRTWSLELPELPAGDYRLMEAAQDNSTKAASYSVPFTVPEGCIIRPGIPRALNPRVISIP